MIGPDSSRMSSRSAGARPKVLASAATGVMDAIRLRGGDVDRIFGDAHLDTRDITDPFNELSLAQYCELFEQAARHTGFDNFGLRFGYEFRPRQLGPLGYLAVNSPTLRAALRNITGYFPAHQESSTLALREHGEFLALDYQIRDARIARRRQDAELSIGMFCNVFWHCKGRDWRPVEIHFEHPRPANAKEHERLYDAPVYFSQPTNSVLFLPAELDAVMPEADPYLLPMLISFMSGRQKMVEPDNFASLVQHEISANLASGNVTVKRIAARLGLTCWQLNRQLQALGADYADLVRGARHAMALQYLAESQVPLTEIALLLGYSELSAFSRAFRHWTGVSPVRYRRMLVAP